ncbi:MAG: hypothetical protein A2W25_05330 [candidate division Zixibacteria bacterium RBG_16_53_22]|nr:MAG: hypothetical protein A2W25_05330 [candidate division Zixibacteria bacterium RBG_16_53_22]
MSGDLGIWLAAFLTLAIYSFLYRDNPVYRFAESLLIGVSVGFLLVVAFDTTILPKALEPIAAQIRYVSSNGASGIPMLIWVIIPVVLGLFMFARFVPGWAWLSRIALALYIGFGAGVSIPANMQSYILKQIEGTIRPFLEIHSAWDIFSALFILVGLIAVIGYFFFSKAHTGNFGRLARLGTWFLMVFFGATFGYTVMARISLLIGRLQFLLGDWLGLIS